jgi:hypothetical protein
MTDFAKKVEILAEFHSDYWADPEFEEFNQFNDAGLPLAYLYLNGFCELEMKGEVALEETWTHLLQTLGVSDSGYQNLSEVFQASLNTNP